MMDRPVCFDLTGLIDGDATPGSECRRWMFAYTMRTPGKWFIVHVGPHAELSEEGVDIHGKPWKRMYVGQDYGNTLTLCVDESTEELLRWYRSGFSFPYERGMLNMLMGAPAPSRQPSLTGR